MSKIGYGYGSEWHLLRYLGYHRNRLIETINELPAFNGKKIEFLDFNFSSSNDILKQDQEYKGIDAIGQNGLPAKWAQYWPQTGNPQNWDAVAISGNNGQEPEWIFIEAKAHTGEITSTCGAVDDSKKKIKSSFIDTIGNLGLDPNSVDGWFSPYYQFCNRLAFLNFLLENNISAHLLFIYFYGDSNPSASCPAKRSDWDKALKDMYDHIKLDPDTVCEQYKQRVHKIFLSTNPNVAGDPSGDKKLQRSLLKRG